MTLVNWLATWKTRLEHPQPRRTGRRPASHPPATARLRTDRLKDRLTPSGFGPQDGAYIVESWIGSYSDVQIQPGDQRIVAAGQVNPNNNYTDQRMAIARYDSLGNPGNTYGSGGPSIPPLSGVSAPPLGPSNEFGDDLVLLPDGKAFVSAGMNGVNSSFVLARFNTNGTLDSDFGSGGWNSLDARANDFNPAEGVALQSTGKVVVAGVTLAFGAYSNPAEVARFTSSGTLDSGKGGFGRQQGNNTPGYTLTLFGLPKNGFRDLAVQPDDKVVAVDFSYSDSNNKRLIVARYTASGTLDSTFNGVGFSVFLPPGISDSIGTGVALQSDGKIVVTGYCTGTDGANDLLVIRYNANGSLDDGGANDSTPGDHFGVGGYVRLDIDGTASTTAESGSDVAIQPDGKIVVGGVTSVTGNPSKVLVARFNVNGTPDGTFATGGFKIGAPLANTGYHSFDCEGVATLSDGSIIVAGDDDWDSTMHNYTPHPLLMRFLPTPASPLLAAGGAASAVSDTPHLTAADLKPILLAAIDRWAAAGLDAKRLDVMRHATVTIENLGGSYLGLADPVTHGIRIDDDAAGHGWFVDSTPMDDSEFSKPGDQGEQRRMDLVSVITHELGHLVGLDHDDHDGDVMGESLTTGTRRVPTADDVKQAMTASGNQPTHQTKIVTPYHRRPVRRR